MRQSHSTLEHPTGNMSGYPGMLPTLGLNKYKNTDLSLNQKNPYKVQKKTEKLLIFCEREREFKGFNKLEKEGQRVFEKEMQSRPNRQGVIREIKNIKASSSQAALAQKGQKALQAQANDENQNKQKLNIFDQQDSTMLKREALAKMGYGEEQKSMMLASHSQNALEQRSHSSLTSSRGGLSLEPIQKPKAIEYL
mmetsp:Transcript_9388/g.14309  ORF Transcript_9388/g.14309 Transcript_9388/m.14309 type:complete len:195 (+) Transcript_9388:254-838(+)